MAAARITSSSQRARPASATAAAANKSTKAGVAEPPVTLDPTRAVATWLVSERSTAPVGPATARHS